MLRRSAGVGKTSLGRSIARALGRKFERISVGGVRDEAEIRGHRRTYIGAMPGTIIRALRGESRNPVFMIDEIDKMGADFRGDPASAMLEVLDPAQNSSFRDHFLDLEFDLSDVLFIATGNFLDPIPPPLQDRMEVIQLSGYTLDELHIAEYLVPRQIEENGLKSDQIEFEDEALKVIADEYTREAGVRNLERQIGTVCRKIARDAAEGKLDGKTVISADRARELLGPRKFFAEQPAAPRIRGRHRPRVDAGRRRGAVRRGDRDGWLGEPHDHGTARRRDEGVGAGGPVLGPGTPEGARPRPPRRLVRKARHPHPRPLRRGAQGRTLRRGRDSDRARLAREQPARVQRRRDDRRDHAHGSGAPDRRREIARRPAGRIKRVIVPERNKGDREAEHERQDLVYVYVSDLTRCSSTRSRIEPSGAPPGISSLGIRTS